MIAGARRTRAETAAMVMAHRDGACVRDVVVAWNVGDTKEIGDHARNLWLARGAIPAYRLLHLRWRVLGDRDAFASERAEHELHAPR